MDLWTPYLTAVENAKQQGFNALPLSPCLRKGAIFENIDEDYRLAQLFHYKIKDQILIPIEEACISASTLLVGELRYRHGIACEVFYGGLNFNTKNYFEFDKEKFQTELDSPSDDYVYVHSWLMLADGTLYDFTIIPSLDRAHNMSDASFIVKMLKGIPASSGFQFASLELKEDLSFEIAFLESSDFKYEPYIAGIGVANKLNQVLT